MIEQISNVNTTNLNLITPTHEDVDPELNISMTASNIALDAVEHNVTVLAYTPNF